MDERVPQFQPVVRLPAAIKPAAVLPEAPPNAPEMAPLPAPVTPSTDTGLKLEPKYKFGGRPKGIKDSHPRQAPHFKISHWFKLLNREWPKLIPAQRANICVDMIKMITAKLPKLPSSQRDSTKSAHEVYDALLELERSIHSPIENCSGEISLNNSNSSKQSLLSNVNTDQVITNPLLNQTGIDHVK